MSRIFCTERVIYKQIYVYINKYLIMVLFLMGSESLETSLSRKYSIQLSGNKKSYS